MFSRATQRVFIALIVMGLLSLGAVSAEARDTKGADRLVKGAVAGAAVGTVTQVVRGRTQGKELLKGAAVGGAVGAAVGAYGDYRQEKDARLDEQRRADYYESRARRNARPAYRWQDDQAYRNGRHRHSARCGHRR
jgi:uncharacterized membrane protein YebE (DUF533 family)